MIPPDTKNYVFNTLEHIYQCNNVGNCGNHYTKKWVKELSPPPDIMTFPNFLTILTHKFIH